MMTLEHITRRLELFKVYLAYKIAFDIKYWPRQVVFYDPIDIRPTNKDLIRRFKRTGRMYYDLVRVQAWEPLKHFDTWLFDNQHYDLVDFNKLAEERDISPGFRCSGSITDYDWARNVCNP